MASKLRVGQVAYSIKTEKVYVYLGKIVVNCSYAAEYDATRDQRQTVQVWFTHAHQSTLTYLKREPDTMREKVQHFVTHYQRSYAWEDTFIVSEKPNLMQMDMVVDVDAYAIVEYFIPLYRAIKGYRSDGNKCRIKWYLCNGEWCRKHIIDCILQDLKS